MSFEVPAGHSSTGTKCIAGLLTSFSTHKSILVKSSRDRKKMKKVLVLEMHLINK